MSITIDPTHWRYRLRAVLTPACWLQKERYNEAWDKKLRELLANHDFTDCGKYTAMLGNVKVWTANHPYASMAPHGHGIGGVRASRATILYAGDRLNEVRRTQDRDAMIEQLGRPDTSTQ